jgi:two-component system response regulator PilR (NtrC family)
MESEFFGHKKGSFTGAHADKPGLFQAAEGGTLFLDEVAELPLAMQVKLLRAIQEKSVRPVGANGEVPVDVRILSATHKNLAALVEDGRFRHDLYYRINVIAGQGRAQEAYGDLEGYLEDIEREIISAALEESRWNKTATAKLLGISFRSLRYRQKKLGLED